MLDWLAAALLTPALLDTVGLFDSGTAAGRCSVPLALLAASSAWLIVLRSRRPVAAFAATLAVSVPLAVAAKGVVPWLFLPAAFVLYQVVIACRRRTSCLAVAVAVTEVAALAGMGRWGGPPGTEAAVSGMALILAWGIGFTVRQNRTAAERQRTQARERAAAEERLRIAREMHDLVAHSMSVIAVQASLGHYVIADRPADAEAALSVIETTSREVLAEMRTLLGVLRHDEANPEEDDLAPARGLSDLDHLMARTADAGVRADLRESGRARQLPPGIELSAYRIIQEALTNVVRHSGASRCTVALDYRDDTLLIEVTDHGPLANPAVRGQRRSAAQQPARRPGGGHGLIGMRERAGLHRGRFTAGPLAHGGFQVTAALPLSGGVA